MPLLRSLFVIGNGNYKDVAPTVLKSGEQNRVG